MSNVDSIKKNKQSSMDWTPVETLRQLANEIERGDIEADRLIICFDKRIEGNQLLTGWRQANIKCYESLSLLKITESDMLKEIG